jgi:hypothetical protein
MPTHKFQIGQTAFLNPSNRHIPEGACVVTKKLPERDGEFDYRVKSANELHEPVVRERYYQACRSRELPPQLITLSKKLDEELLKKPEHSAIA